MPFPLSSGAADRVSSCLIAAVLTVPMMIVTAALTPVFIIGPFLSERHQRLVHRLIAGLRQWTQVIIMPVRRDTS